ncbi:hypothetical protein BABINDRAFT_159823 [Babjeviella inositovora NRRL Y-12698]|uniref:LCCL domain-containing protein n=1 Tax=Babjeviella inositovora NRRL Y-12698 TaxID=984486 RepID=A0A1E3QX14_9ASCO|nr:uncharacterized protein BABINDRAFT_159823 [Babjeviella inositovora NRRL Y-12698]ODQ81547.1 hypothetical protein BABINDRAFT_159823 [Babjeviella inositovora NRRL Y-12698]
MTNTEYTPPSLAQHGEFELEVLEVDKHCSHNPSPYRDSTSGSEAAFDNETIERLLQGRKYPRTVKGKIIRIVKLIWTGPETPSDEPTPRFRALKRLDNLPGSLKKTLPLWLQVGIVSIYLLLWLWLLSLVLLPYLTQIPTYIDSNGKQMEVISVTCNQQKLFWKGKNTACGLNGKACEPFDKEDVVFRCPALCDRESFTFSSIPVGDQTVKYRGYFIGGGDVYREVSEDQNEHELSLPYRADSYPCGAAIHAGIISPFFGGCARISYTGEQEHFPSKIGHYGVSPSLEFNSFFPSSFIFKKLPKVSVNHDPRLVVTLMNIIMGIPVVYFAPAVVSFWTMFTVAFWTIILALDPPYKIDPSDPEMLASLVSLGLERFLPSCFIAFTMWHVAVRHTMSDPPEPFLPSPFTRTLFWYPVFWLGVMNNLTFDRLPVDRLTWKDLASQPGALTAVSCIFSVIILGVLIQAYQLWHAGKFRKYLAIYLLFVLGLVLLSHLPGLTLRVHHYILGMLLIPGTRTRGSQALLFQGVLIGLFISGAARWGLASILETDTHLRREDPDERVSPPSFLGYHNETGVLSWHPTAQKTENGTMAVVTGKFDGYALMINDIQRYEGKENHINMKELIKGNPDFETLVDHALESDFDNDGNILLYLRVARAVSGKRKYSAFTQAAILKWPSGEFTAAKRGIT